MRMANIRFDDPEDLAQPSRIFISVMKDLELLDYARRYFSSLIKDTFPPSSTAIKGTGTIKS
jgi:hypothetical protein